MAAQSPTLISDNSDVYDVFISYAHFDDEVLPEDSPSSGFVTRLVARIKRWGRAKYGKELKLFFDTDLASGVLWKPSILQALDSCRIFVPIISPNWLNSTWGAVEWDAVWKRAEKESLTGNRTRIIPVWYELEKLLEEFENCSIPAGQQELQRRLQKVRELELKRRFRISMSDEEFKATAAAIADDVVSLLIKLKEISGRSMADGNTSSVFLGFAFSARMRNWKENVRNGLKANGFEVQEVEFNGSGTAQQLSGAIKKSVRGCAAAVHFLEESFGPSLTGDRTRGVVQIQCDAVTQMMEEVKNTRLLQFFWTGPDLRIGDVQEQNYKEFLEKVKRSDEHMTESASTFVKSLVTCVKQPESPSDPRNEPDDTSAKLTPICVICERDDKDIAEYIRSYFAKKKGWAVLVPKLDIDPNFEQKAIADEYAKVFRKYQHFLFYWGKGGDYWCKNNFYMLVDARTLPGGKQADPPIALLYCGQEKVDYKEKADFWLWLKALRWDGFDPDSKEVEDFVSQVEKENPRGQLWSKPRHDFC